MFRECAESRRLASRFAKFRAAYPALARENPHFQGLRILGISLLNQKPEYRSRISGIMTILFQHSSELAIRAMTFLAQQSPGKLTPVHEIAAQMEISEAYLAKVLQRLAAAGLVRSFRGPGRGMELGRAPQAITLSSIVIAVQGAAEWKQCVLGFGMCSEENPCALHSGWLPLRGNIRQLLEKTTLADMALSLQKRRSEQSVKKNPESSKKGQL